MLTTDTRRTVPARVVADISAPDVAPGDVEVLAIDGAVWGYGFACAGCGARSFLAIGEENPPPRWRVVAGDPAHPDAPTRTLTLSPSILHATANGGCGWHGYLTCGVFTPC